MEDIEKRKKTKLFSVLGSLLIYCEFEYDVHSPIPMN